MEAQKPPDCVQISSSTFEETFPNLEISYLISKLAGPLASLEIR